MRLPIQNSIEFLNRNFFRSVVHFQINFFKKETRFLFKLNFVLKCHYAIYQRLCPVVADLYRPPSSYSQRLEASLHYFKKVSN